MQIGDPKKTVVLAIVAVGAIGFCFKQLTGGGDSPKALRGSGGSATPDATAPTGQATLAVLSLDQLRNDAFSHPKLASKLAPQPTAAQNSTETAAPSKTQGSQEPVHALIDPAAIAKNGNPNWAEPVDPLHDKNFVKTAEVAKVTQITLKAIITAGQRVACLSIDGQAVREFKPGDLIKDDIQVAFVNDDSVIVKSGKKTVTLKVGQQGDL